VCFPVEEIPDEDTLFMRIHYRILGKKGLHPGVFINHNNEMSTNWSHYADAEVTKMQANLYDKNPDDYGVIDMNVGNVRNIDGQTVIHNPIPKDRAHTDVVGKKTEKARLDFYELSSWVIPPPSPS